MEKTIKRKKQVTSKGTKSKKKWLWISLLVLVLLGIFTVIYLNYSVLSTNFTILLGKGQQTITLQNVKQLSLWDLTRQNVKSQNKGIQIQYNGYQILLNSEKMSNYQDISILVQNKKSEIAQFPDLEIVEIDVSQLSDISLVQTIQIDAQKYLSSLTEVDVFAVPRGENSLKKIENQKIQQNQVTISCHSQYTKYILVYVPVQQIQIPEEQVTLDEEQEYQLKSTVIPENATNKTVMINLGEGDCLELKGNNTLIAKKIGVQQITFETQEGTVKKTLTVTVQSKQREIQVEKDEWEVKEGQSVELKAKLLPEGANQNLIYKSLNESIATIDGNGKITGVSQGTAIIIISTSSVPVQTKQIKVNVIIQQEEEENEGNNQNQISPS